VLPVHLGQFGSEEGIAEAKAEIFLGLEAHGIAILNGDNRHFERLGERARARGARVVPFGLGATAEWHVQSLVGGESCSDVELAKDGRTIRYRLGAPGRHLAENSLAVATVLDVLGLDVERGLAELAAFRAPAGRGERTEIGVRGGAFLLIDEGYNANPASVAAALAAMSGVPRARFPRRIAVLGDMLELGAASEGLHLALARTIDEGGVDLVFACGPEMGKLYRSLPERSRGAHRPTSDELAPIVAGAVQPGDVVMIKGSLGTRMAPIVAAVKGLAA